uniref:Uncharacterized protein n=1 Tax=Anopheles albimanus TaxID=7167 RepID=A0A182FYR2_ANOAL
LGGPAIAKKLRSRTDDPRSAHRSSEAVQQRVCGVCAAEGGKGNRRKRKCNSNPPRGQSHWQRSTLSLVCARARAHASVVWCWAVVVVAILGVTVCSV